MMSDSKQQFSSGFLSNDLDQDYVKNDYVKSGTAKLKTQINSSLLDGVAVFPDGSVMWVPESDGTRDDGMQCQTSLPCSNHLPGQPYSQNRNLMSSAAVALIKRVIKCQVLSFQRVLR
jgi:hypothetical protein